MTNNKASALIVALMMVSILFLITTVLLEFINFYYLDTNLVYEREKLKLISEREILKTIISLQEGILITNSYFDTNTDNFIYKVSREIKKSNNIFYITLYLESNKVKIIRNLLLYSLIPTDFCYINLSKLHILSNTKSVFWGYSFLNDVEGFSTDSFFAFKYPPIFSENTNVSIKAYIAEATVSPETPSLDINIKHPTNYVNLIPLKVDIDNIIEKAYKMVYKDWLIKDYIEDIEQIVNPLISKKTLLGRFYYRNPILRVNYETIGNIYFSYDKDKTLTIEDIDVYGSRGEYLRKFIKFQNGNLSFITEPVNINLPIEFLSYTALNLIKNF